MLQIRMLIIVFLLFGVKILIGCSVCSYFYAFGTNEINVYWDYYSDNPEELLGCNLFRYEDDPNQSYQVNQELIVSEDKDFYYLDTTDINVALVYFYRVEFIFANDTLSYDPQAGSFKNVEFNVITPTLVELAVEPKIPGECMVNVYWCDFSSWVIVSTLTFENVFIVEMDPYQTSPGYIMYHFYNYGNDLGNILTSHTHLMQMILTHTPEYAVPEISINSFPNPFTETTQINLDVSNSDYYYIKIYNCNGELIRTIVNSRLNAGDFSITWDRKNDTGIKVENGLYYCTVNSGKTKQTIKLLVQ